MIRSPLGVRSIRKSRLRWQSLKNSSSVKRFIAGPKWSTSGEPIESVVTVAIVVFLAVFALTITSFGRDWKPAGIRETTEKAMRPRDVLEFGEPGGALAGAPTSAGRGSCARSE